jgi:hypothetical protein
MLTLSVFKSGASSLKRCLVGYKAGKLVFILPYSYQNISQFLLPLLQKQPSRWMSVHRQLYPGTEYY